jgi:transposase
MRPHGTPQRLEKRRRHAIQLLKTGKNLSAVARWLGASVSSVFRWYQTYREQGLKGLRPRRIPGRPPKLSRSQKEALIQLLVKGALAAGYSTDLWTTQRVADLTWKHFRIRYHRDYMGPLLAQLGWSYQKPERRARERNEAAIAHWKRYRWPALKKTAAAGRSPRVPR